MCTAIKPDKLSVINCQLSAQNGQTVLEVLVALTLIILFLTGVVIIELYATRNSEYAQTRSLATSLAGQQLERARVVRDSAGISSLNVCLSSCYINGQLTPVPAVLGPTGTFSQSLTIKQTSLSDQDCQLPAVTITPNPVVYKATALVSWAQNANVTPAPQLVVSSCITDWR